MVSTAVCSKAVVLLLFIMSLFIVSPFVCVGFGLDLFCYAVLCVLSSFAIISLGKRELVALLLLPS